MRSNQPPIVTVSQVNSVINRLISNDSRLGNVAVRGEISNFTRHHQSGHLYFTLKDERTQLSAVMFASNAAELEFEPENGMSVICRGQIVVYEPNGKYQIKCWGMFPDGAGQQAAALEELKNRLAAEGVFSQKRPIPAMPKKIAVVTSTGGDALQDIRNILSRRFPLVTLVIVPAQVQGISAPQSIAAALERAQSTGADTIIFGRGGGSAEDLSAFNAEIVARSVYNSRIPTISAVGHETDFSLADFAADLRAPTPSAAAELSVPTTEDILSSIENMHSKILGSVTRLIAENESSLRYNSDIIKARSPQSRINIQAQQLDSISARIKNSIHAKLERSERALERNADIISALNPMEILVRGYSVTYHNDRIITSAEGLKNGDRLDIRLSRGSVSAQVTNISTEE